MPTPGLWIRGFPERWRPMLSESRCLQFDPEILSDRHSGTPICQNSVLVPRRTHISITPSPEMHMGAVRTLDMFLGNEL
ncbi:hypothetical protein CgunFtcFv8_006388 [Champsocephalus gunnari]|uniref:Uncharacterized protein n=1 Tax=Champsocephalus gunnari TaxID=52237 RepID=A0AAN8BY27_CHAGU|nr:hypothetical protein CgunFtcFv8_006388 [Champsocephalus gunnari]